MTSTIERSDLIDEEQTTNTAVDYNEKNSREGVDGGTTAVPTPASRESEINSTARYVDLTQSAAVQSVVESRQPKFEEMDDYGEYEPDYTLAESRIQSNLPQFTGKTSEQSTRLVHDGLPGYPPPKDIQTTQFDKGAELAADGAGFVMDDNPKFIIASKDDNGNDIKSISKGQPLPAMSAPKSSASKAAKAEVPVAEKVKVEVPKPSGAPLPSVGVNSGKQETLKSDIVSKGDQGPRETLMKHVQSNRKTAAVMENAGQRKPDIQRIPQSGNSNSNSNSNTNNNNNNNNNNKQISKRPMLDLTPFQKKNILEFLTLPNRANTLRLSPSISLPVHAPNNQPPNVMFIPHFDLPFPIRRKRAIGVTPYHGLILDRIRRDTHNQQSDSSSQSPEDMSSASSDFFKFDDDEDKDKSLFDFDKHSSSQAPRRASASTTRNRKRNFAYFPMFAASEKPHNYGILGSGNFEIIRGGFFGNDEIASSDHNYIREQSNGYPEGEEYDDVDERLKKEYGQYSGEEFFSNNPVLGFQGYDNFQAASGEKNNESGESRAHVTPASSEKVNVYMDKDLMATS